MKKKERKEKGNISWYNKYTITTIMSNKQTNKQNNNINFQKLNFSI